MNPYTVFRDEGHEVWRRWRTVIDEYGASHPDRDLMMVAEAYATRRPELTRAFTRQDEFHQMFAFDLMLTPWHKESVERALGDIIGILDETGVAPAWTLNNHDTQRIVTRLGRPEAEDPESWTGNALSTTGTDIDLELGDRRARALAALAFAVPGSLYLYQGEELGLPEVFDIPDDRREDPVFHLTGGEGLGRDGCRIPLPWTTDAATSFGFSTPPATVRSAAVAAATRRLGRLRRDRPGGRRRIDARLLPPPERRPPRPCGAERPARRTGRLRSGDSSASDADRWSSCST